MNDFPFVRMSVDGLHDDAPFHAMAADLPNPLPRGHYSVNRVGVRPVNDMVLNRLFRHVRYPPFLRDLPHHMQMPNVGFGRRQTFPLRKNLASEKFSSYFNNSNESVAPVGFAHLPANAGCFRSAILGSGGHHTNRQEVER
jgi:hypothetical protein